MNILGIETSCDENAAAVVQDGRKLLSNIIFSQIDLHKIYGGVVPEVAARSHIEVMIPVIEHALQQAFPEINVRAPGSDNRKEILRSKATRTKSVRGVSTRNIDVARIESAGGLLGSAEKQASAARWAKIDAIAVTKGPGLGGSLLIGTLTARTLALIKDKPIYGLNHVLGHVYANFIDFSALKSDSQLVIGNWEQPEFPLLALIVSGGHTQLALFKDHFDYELLGQTQDDAVGEAFDKVAKILGLEYPGGPSVQTAAKGANAKFLELPQARMDNKYDFSFSGLKTAVLRAVQELVGVEYDFPSFELKHKLSAAQVKDIAASFQHVAAKTLVDKTELAFKEFSPKTVVIAGGVAANTELRRQLNERLPLNIDYAPISLCTDNAAMMASLGYYYAQEHESDNARRLEIEPSLAM